MLTIGGTLALVAIAVLYLALGAPRPAELLAMVRGDTRIAPGFIGMANFGRWRLICVPGPPSLDGLNAAAAPAPDNAATVKVPTGNACRINQEIAAPGLPGLGQNAVREQTAGRTPDQPPAAVIIAANFSLVGPKRTPAAMLRLPATARAGDAISLRFDDETVITTIVRDCAATECLAAGTLSDSDWAHLSAAKSLRVTFPAAGRQWVLLDLPVEGLAAAVAALSRAELPGR